MIKIQKKLNYALSVCLLGVLFSFLIFYPVNAQQNPVDESECSFDIVFMLDTSGSMSERDGDGVARIEELKGAVRAFFNSTGHDHIGAGKRVQIGVTVFGLRPTGPPIIGPGPGPNTPLVRTVIPLSRGARADQIQNVVNQMRADGTTPTGSGMQESIRNLQTADRPDAKNIFIVVSDGLPNDNIPPTALPDWVNFEVVNRNMPAFQSNADEIYSVYIGASGISNDPVDIQAENLMIRFAKPADTFHYKKATNTQLIKFFEDIGRKIHECNYKPTPAPPKPTDDPTVTGTPGTQTPVPTTSPVPTTPPVPTGPTTGPTPPPPPVPGLCETIVPKDYLFLIDGSSSLTRQGLGETLIKTLDSLIDKFDFRNNRVAIGDQTGWANSYITGYFGGYGPNASEELIQEAKNVLKARYRHKVGWLHKVDNGGVQPYQNAPWFNAYDGYFDMTQSSFDPNIKFHRPPGWYNWQDDTMKNDSSFLGSNCLTASDMTTEQCNSDIHLVGRIQRFFSENARIGPNGEQVSQLIVKFDDGDGAQLPVGRWGPTANGGTNCTEHGPELQAWQSLEQFGNLHWVRFLSPETDKCNLKWTEEDKITRGGGKLIQYVPREVAHLIDTGQFGRGEFVIFDEKNREDSIGRLLDAFETIVEKESCEDEPVPCVYTKPQQPVIDPNAELKDQMTRLTAVGHNVDLQWIHNGDFSTTGDNCENKKGFEVFFTRKADTDISTPGADTIPGCDFSNVQPVFVGKDERKFPVTPDQLEFNSAYCWKVKAINGPEETESPTYTFRTNMSPKFLRMGMQFPGAPVDSDASTIGTQNYPNVGTPICGSGVPTDICTIPNTENTFGGDICWSGKINVGQTDTVNPVTFWFEYEDIDNYDNPWSGNQVVNENLRHKAALVPETPDLSTGINGEISKTGINSHHLSTYNLKSPAPQDASNGRYGQTSTKVRKVENAQNLIRVYHTITINENYPTGRYSIYSVFESEIMDARPSVGKTGIALADQTKDPQNQINKGATGDHLFSKRGRWSVDNEPPVTNVESKITGPETFDITWQAFEKNFDLESGLDNIIAVCYTSVGNPEYVLTYNGPMPPQMSIDIKAYDQPPDTHNCLPVSAVTYMKGVTDGKYTGNYSLDTFIAKDIKAQIKRAVDRACNTSEPPAKTITLPVLDPWLTTREGGSFYSDTGVTLDVPTAVREENQSFFKSVANTPFFKVVEQEILNVASNFLGTESGNLRNASRVGAQVTDYIDNNEFPKGLTSNNDWYNFFLEEIKRQGFGIQEIGGDAQRGGNIVDAFGINNPSIDMSITKVNGNLTINSDSSCSGKGVTFVEGDLVIFDNFLNANENSGCIFIVKGNLYLMSVQNNPSSGQITSHYDTVEGFFIVPFGETFVTNPSIPKTITDPLFIKGSIIGRKSNFARTVGLRNILQPAEYMSYDPRYIYLFGEIGANRILSLREKGFSTNYNYVVPE